MVTRPARIGSAFGGAGRPVASKRVPRHQAQRGLKTPPKSVASKLCGRRDVRD
jgi:hypothetical protein